MDSHDLAAALMAQPPMPVEIRVPDDETWEPGDRVYVNAAALAAAEGGSLVVTLGVTMDAPGEDLGPVATS